MNQIPVSVVLITLNEEYHLPGVLDNLLGWVQEIFVVDSLSTDRTVDVALERGAVVVQRPFGDFGDQWNWALMKLPITTPWTLKIDPDERMSDELKKEIEKTVSANDPAEGYSFPRRLWFMGRPLHVRQDVVRLWKTGRCQFSNVIVNEQPIINGEVGRLHGILEHLDARDLHAWCEKQNRYSTAEAVMRLRGDDLAVSPRLLGTPLERRMFLKRMFYSVPLRYQFLYWYHLLGQGVWQDGATGRLWARLRTEVYRMCEAKVREMRQTGKIPDVPKATHGCFDSRVLASRLQQELLPETLYRKR
jgi:glycosyltransferase involved in cell wall biosynthesis